MPPTPRSVPALLSLQAGTLIILSFGLLALVWNEWETRSAQVEAPRTAVEVARQHAEVVLRAPYLYVATRDEELVERSRDSVAEARGALQLVQRLVPETETQTRTAIAGLHAVETAAGLIYASHATGDMAGAYEELAVGRASLLRALSTLEAVSESEVQHHYEAAQTRHLVLWVGMLIVTLGTSVGARRMVMRSDKEHRQALARINHGAHAAVRAALEGLDPVPVPTHPEMGPALEALERSVDSVRQLRRQSTKATRNATFTADLLDALTMADSEPEVMATGVRAARMAYPEVDFQVLTVDEGTNTADAHDAKVARVCTLGQADQCPALRRARTLFHHPGEAMNLCSKLRSQEDAVCCTPVHVGERAVAVAQLSGYDPAVLTRFEEMENLALALGARTSVLRGRADDRDPAESDVLTGLPNRRMMDDRLAQLDAADLKYGIVVADLDHFKQYNEAHGTDAGDRCLQIFADVLREACRGSDMACRLGGEEFVVILPTVGMRAGLAVAMRIRAYLADAGARAPAPFTVSLGVAARPEHGGTAEAVLRAADAAMYDAKDAGRDQIVPARVLPSPSIG